MPKRVHSRLLASELEILDVLWTHGPLSIVEVQRQLPKEPGYTTVQTRLNRMAGKGLLDRSETRPSKYSALISRDEASSADLKLLLKKVSEGSVVPLVAQLIQDRKISQKQFDELKSLIRTAERNAQVSRKKE